MRIPVITTDISYPVVRPGDVSSGFRAQAEMGQDVQSLINTIAQGNIDIRNKFKQADDLIITSQKKNEYVMFSEEQSKSLDVDPDVNNRFDKWMSETQRKRVELLSTIKDDLLRKKVEAELSHTTLGLMINEKNKRFVQKAEIQSADADRTIIELANIGDVENAKKISQKMVDIGIWKPSQKLEKDNQIEETAEKSNIVLRINSQNAKMIQSLIDDLDKGMYKKISPLERANYRVLAEKNIENINDKKKADEEEIKITNAMDTVKKEWPNSPDMQNVIITDSEWQKEHGLDSKLAHILQIRLNAEQKLIEENRKKTQEQTSLEAYGMWSKGTLNKKWIDDKVSTGKLSEEKGEHWNQQLLNPPDIKTDPQEYFDIVKSIETKPRDQVENMILRSKKLSREMKISLGSELYKTEDKINGGWIKLAEDEIKDMIIPKRGILAPITASQSELMDYNKAREAFKAALEKAEKSGKPLQGQEILTRAREIAKGFQKSIAIRTLEMFKEMGRTGEELKKAVDIKKKGDKYKTLQDLQKDVSSGKIDDVLALEIIRYKGWGD